MVRFRCEGASNCDCQYTMGSVHDPAQICLKANKKFVDHILIECSIYINYISCLWLYLTVTDLKNKPNMTAEHLARALGKPGKFQMLLYMMLAMNYVYVCWNHLGMAFLAAKTKHHCRVENKTDIARLVPLVNKHGKMQKDQCHLYAAANDTKKIPCPNGWTYYLPDRESTVIEKVSNN